MRVSAFVACSVDNYIASPRNHPTPGADYGFAKFYQSVDALIVGRHTFARNVRSDIWPYGTTPMQVMSRRYVDVPATLARHVQVTGLAPSELMAAMARDQYRHVFIDGALTIQSFLHAGLITEFTLTRIPALLGQGVALFDQTGNTSLTACGLTHSATRTWQDGTVQSHYRINR